MSTQQTNERTGQRPVANTAAAPLSAIPPTEAIKDYLTEYARAKPEVVTMWAFGVGFILGWKLKPW